MNGTARAKATNSSVGKPGQVRGRLQPAGVDRQQHEREREREEDVGRLPERAHDRAAAELEDVCGEVRHGRRPRADAASDRRPARDGAARSGTEPAQTRDAEARTLSAGARASPRGGCSPRSGAMSPARPARWPGPREVGQAATGCAARTRRARSGNGPPGSAVTRGPPSRAARPRAPPPRPRPRACARSSPGRRRRARERGARGRRPVSDSASSARTTSASPSSRLASRTATSPPDAPTDSPNRVSTAAMAWRSSGPRRHDPHGRPRDLRLEVGRGALGDDVAVVDDADAVGEDVGLLQVLRRQEDRDAVLAARAGRPRFQSAARLCGSSPVVGSSRKRIRGRCTSASARSSRRFMPPE